MLEVIIIEKKLRTISLRRIVRNCYRSYLQMRVQAKSVSGR